MSQHVRKGSSVYVEEGANIFVAVASYFVSPAVALQILKYTILNGIYRSLVNETIVIYKGTVYYDLDAKVNGTVRARAGRTRKVNIYLGHTKNRYEQTSVVQDYNYGNYDYILDQAITNYLNRYN